MLTKTGSRWKKGLKAVVFVTIFVVLVWLLQVLFEPKWNYPLFIENTSYSVSSFFDQKPESDEVVLLGTSHAFFDMSPMEMYKQTGVVSYNLATTRQAVNEMYVLAEEVLRLQKPRLLILDVSNLFFGYDIDDYVVCMLCGASWLFCRKCI